jgi:hypothetical protein
VSRQGDLVRTLEFRDLGGGQYGPVDEREQRAYDFTSSAIYVGAAPAGAATSAATWTIKKIGLDASGNPISTLHTDLFAAVWDDRATETYT